MHRRGAAALDIENIQPTSWSIPVVGKRPSMMMMMLIVIIIARMLCCGPHRVAFQVSSVSPVLKLKLSFVTNKFAYLWTQHATKNLRSNTKRRI